MAAPGAAPHGAAVLTPAPAPQRRRLALVMGASKYDHPGLQDLHATKLDVDAMATQLRRAGFDVTIVQDATCEELRDALDKFAAGLDAGCELALFHFAGHGLEYYDEQGKTMHHCVLGRDWGAGDALGDPAAALPVADVVRVLGRARQGVALLDACRTVADGPQLSGAHEAAYSRWGELRCRLPVNVVVAHACAPGGQAFTPELINGVWAASWFTSELLKVWRAGFVAGMSPAWLLAGGGRSPVHACSGPGVCLPYSAA